MKSAGGGLRLALYEPDIPQNAAALLRTCACLGVGADIIGAPGFAFGGSHMTAKARRAGMDYLEYVELARHDDWAAFEAAYAGARRVLLTTKGETPYAEFAFQAGDILVCGRESAGVPDFVHAAADARLVVPMRAGMRSLNLAAATSMVLGEALRQLSAFQNIRETT
jgi:tRNA (cytidine/uridine-2'-O-)-methyltransferase